MKIRKAVIPAAGLGTRVLPASKAMPKEMLPIVDKPAIQFIVEEAVNGNEAVELLKEKEPGFYHFVLMDIEMPQMDGYHLTKLIKENDATKDIPVIIFSSLVNEEMRAKGEQLGVDAQLSKPEIVRLVEVLDSLLLK